MPLSLSALLTSVSSAAPNAQFAAVEAYFNGQGRLFVVHAAMAISLRFPLGTGVYVVRKRTYAGLGDIVYIGKAGKLQNARCRFQMNCGKLPNRLPRWHPYCYQIAGPYANHFEFGPNFGVNELKRQPFPGRYKQHVPLRDLETACFVTDREEQEIAPAFLEGLLLQFIIREVGNLPPGNNEF